MSAGVGIIHGMHPVAHDMARSEAPVPVESVRTLFPALYAELRRLARSRLAGGGRYTLLDTSSLVHEAFLRMQRQAAGAIHDREHFMAYAATTMRAVIVDFVRRRCAERRGGGAEHVPVDTGIVDARIADDAQLLAVNQALEALAQVDPRLVRVVEMRYFAGLSDAEIARTLGISDRTVRRDWERARLLLAGMIGR